LTEKVYSMRIYKKQGKNRTKIMIDKSIMKFNIISLMFTLLALFIEIYLISKYTGSSDTSSSAYVPFAISLFLQGVIGFAGILILNLLNKESFLEKDFPIQPGKQGLKQGLYYLIGIGSLFLFQMIVQTVVQAVFRLAMEPIDIYFYYLAAAVIEEIFYRMFLISLIIFFFSKINARIPEFIIIFFAMIISSFIFMLVHISAYGERPDLLVAMFFVAMVLATYYILFKDITVPMIGHLLINLLATWIMLGTTNIVV